MTTALLSKGYSSAAIYIDKATEQLSRDYFIQSVLLGKQSAYAELSQVWNDCKLPNWDGDDAIAISYDSVANAHRFIQALSLGYPLPSVGAEPDGSITLEWYKHPQWVLSISVSPAGMLHYAALLGNGETKGTEVFLEEVPSTLLNLIERVMLNA